MVIRTTYTPVVTHSHLQSFGTILFLTMNFREFRIGPFSIAVNWVHAPPLRESNAYKYQPLQTTAEPTQIIIIAINTSRSDRCEPKRGAKSNIAQSHGVDVASLYECPSS